MKDTVCIYAYENVNQKSIQEWARKLRLPKNVSPSRREIEETAVAPGLTKAMRDAKGYNNLSDCGGRWARGLGLCIIFAGDGEGWSATCSRRTSGQPLAFVSM
jgi:hypothetical protein